MIAKEGGRFRGRGENSLHGQWRLQTSEYLSQIKSIGIVPAPWIEQRYGRLFMTGLGVGFITVCPHKPRP